MDLAFTPKTKKHLSKSITKACKMYSKTNPGFQDSIMSQVSNQNNKDGAVSNLKQ